MFGMGLDFHPFIPLFKSQLQWNKYEVAHWEPAQRPRIVWT